MKTFSTPRLHVFKTRRSERGITLMFVVVAIFALLGVSALAIDLVTLFVSKAEAQRVADAAALAGAKGLIDSGVTADPTNSQNNWSDACDQATAQAQGIAAQGKIGGSPPPVGNVTIAFGSGGALGGCPNSGVAGSGFGVNPEISVTVRSVALPLYMAKIWGQQTSTVSATALAEGFNPSGTNVPVAARYVTPWILANIDPGNGGAPIIDTLTGQIENPIPNGVIGKDITLKVGCMAGNCASLTFPTFSGGNPKTVTYYPADLGAPAASGPSCTLPTNYEANVASGNPRPLACGDPISVDATVYPDGNPGPNTNAIKCRINATGTGLGAGQDTLSVAGLPYIMRAGNNNPLVVSGALATNNVISSSSSVVNIPIYDSAAVGTPTGPVKVIGFAQAFVRSVRGNGPPPPPQPPPPGTPRLYILNVSGCKLPIANTPVGTNSASSVPVRLIHP